MTPSDFLSRNYTVEGGVWQRPLQMEEENQGVLLGGPHPISQTALCRQKGHKVAVERRTEAGECQGASVDVAPWLVIGSKATKRLRRLGRPELGDGRADAKRAKP